MKKAFALVSLCAALAPAARAERTVREISWPALREQGRLAGGEIVRAGAGSAADSLRVTNPDGAPRVLPLFELADPGVKAARYMLRGDVRGEGIEGPAYLEMWSVFGGGARYFSRTLAESGPMAGFRGTFPARPFVLPFTAEPGMKLEKLVVNLAFPGRGTVVLGPLRLVELDPGEELGGAKGAWLTPREITRAGAALGSLVGLLGAAVGILAGWGRARALAVGLLWAILGIGLASLAAGALALAAGQGEALVSLLVLLGTVGTAVPAVLLGKLKRQYEELELRRMQALDTR